LAIAGIVPVAILAACSSSISAGDQLTGSWANEFAQFSASSRSVVYVASCMHAEFAPVTLDANRDFLIESTALALTGNVQTGPGTRLELRGHFIQDSLQLQLRLVELPLGVADPVEFVLARGELKGVPVCTA
jgi:hypothetical protein